MKKLLLVAAVVLNLFATEPVQYGGYYGDIKVKIKNYNSYVDNDASSAGTLYLYKQNKSDLDYIYETKIAHINSGLKTAKKYAKKHNNKYFALDNITHEVVITENKVYVFTEYNVLAFD